MAGSLYRVAYALGSAIRWTVSGVFRPLRALSGRLRGGSGRLRSVPAPEIFSRFSRLQQRLQALEGRLLGKPEGGMPQPVAADLRRARKLSSELGRTLAEVLSNPDPAVRELALTTLGADAGEAAIPLILECLNDPAPGVRCAAAGAAARVRASGAVFSLILSLEDGVLPVRKAAKAAIEQITGQSVDFDPADGEAERGKKTEKLKAWWKQERFARLSAEVHGLKT